MEYGLNRSATRFELSGHVEIARTWSQTGSGHIPLRCLARLQVADQFASWSQAGQRNGIWSRTGLRPASELGSVMEFRFYGACVSADLGCCVNILNKLMH